MPLDKITWGRFQIHKIRDSDMEAAPVVTLPFHRSAAVQTYQTTINEPAAQVVVEDFLPGEDIVWTFPHDELQYCLSGEASVEVSMPPLFQETVTAKIEAGCIYYFPAGARMRLSVLNEVPCRHICFCVPNPGYPFPLAESLTDAKG